VLLQHFRGNLDNWDPALTDALATIALAFLTITAFSATPSSLYGLFEQREHLSSPEAPPLLSTRSFCCAPAVAAAVIPNGHSHESHREVLTVLLAGRIVGRYYTGSRGPWQ
jgi:hypothetical protein